MMKILEYINNNITYLDGGMGTMLQSEGLGKGERPEMWNLTHPESVIAVHKAYFDAGSNIVSSNTFGVNALVYSESEMKELIEKAYNNCMTAKNQSLGKQEKFIAFDIGPLGKLLAPFGELEFNEAVEIFSKSVAAASDFGFDLILIETMNDLYETKAALLACKENSSLPVFVTNAYSEDGRLLTGATPEIMAELLESMGACAVGANCSSGPAQMLPVIEKILKSTSLPVIMKPNAGLPVFSDGISKYDIDEESFSSVIASALDSGVRLVGGCCGTTPSHIAALKEKTKDFAPVVLKNNKRTVITSNTRCVEFGKRPVLIGERINPTGKKRFKQALLENDIDYIISEGINQQEKGAHILDVNVGLAGIDEAAMLETVVSELQIATDLPLQLDSADPTALERAMRIYKGKPLVNSVNGKKESMESIFPLIKKYGGSVIALTLDENGIPDTAEKRLDIARKILDKASEYSVDKKDIIFDPLTMAVSTDENSALVTLECIERITNELGCRTSLGVSNISFGLPNRELLNSAFFLSAMNKGLSAAIMNPYSEKMTDVYHSFCALSVIDDGFSSYITYCDNNSVHASERISDERAEDLADSVYKGRIELSSELAEKCLESSDALSVINEKIIPALEKTGKAYQEGRLYLPQLLMSARAAGAAFDVIKSKASSSSQKKCSIILATVEGDVHDIGKNIVKLLLENYGFDVIDLGKDVPADHIVNRAKESGVGMVGLSALMTTTLDSMKKTVALIRQEIPDCKVIVGGAVVTEEFARSINADKYAKDALDTVSFAEDVFSARL